MKASYYNFFLPYNDDDCKLIAYNSRSNALALIEKDKYEKFKRFYSNGEDIDDSELEYALRQGLFLINGYVNELDSIRFNMLSTRYSSTSLSLTIAPTSDCNFRCIYCYEKDVIKPTYMDMSTQEKIVDFLKNKITTINNLNVTWYGGEPLMAFDCIENLSRQFIEICEEHKVGYYASMVTNGYLLSKEIVTKLNEFKVTAMQVTYVIIRMHKFKSSSCSKSSLNLTAF